jgi:hypothetical protein
MLMMKQQVWSKRESGFCMLKIPVLQFCLCCCCPGIIPLVDSSSSLPKSPRIDDAIVEDGVVLADCSNDSIVNIFGCVE